MSYLSEVLADSPAMYLRLGETSGTNANDETANNNDGTYTNSSGYTLNQPSLLTSDPNPSVKLIRANHGYVTVPDANTLDLADIWTVEAWIKLSALGQGTAKQIVSKENGAYGVRINTNDTILMMRSQTANLKHSDAALATVGPHHIVCTKTGATTAIYLNGSAVAATQDGLSTCANNTRALFIGVDGSNGSPTTEYFDGWIDEVAVYPTALTADRVLAHYTAGSMAAAAAAAASPILLQAVKRAAII